MCLRRVTLWFSCIDSWQCYWWVLVSLCVWCAVGLRQPSTVKSCSSEGGCQQVCPSGYQPKWTPWQSFRGKIYFNVLLFTTWIVCLCVNFNIFVARYCQVSQWSNSGVLCRVAFRSAKNISLTRYQPVRSRLCWKVWLGRRLRESRYLPVHLV